MNDEDLSSLEELASACLQRGEGWRWGDSADKVSGYDTPEEMIAEFESVVRKTFVRTPGSHTRHLYSVHAPDDDGGSIIIAHTGNGPTSETHARFFSIAPKAVLALVSALQEERASSRAALKAHDAYVNQVIGTIEAARDRIRSQVPVSDVDKLVRDACAGTLNALLTGGSTLGIDLRAAREKAGAK